MSKNLENNNEKRPIDRILSPFHEFLKLEASSGITLIIATIIALIWANSQWSEAYFALWETKISISVGSHGISNDLIHWINDGLMVIFFFVVGLEIKREVLVGELSSPRQAILPIVAASGGMIVPAAIYLSFNFHELTQHGWGIPMATDIAFAIGVLSLLGNRIPLSLKVFLTAVAIADDLGAVLVIAFFYTDHIVWISLLMAMLILCELIIVNLLGIRSLLVYSLLGIFLWVAFLKSGIHASIAGVLLAMTIPVRTRINSTEFISNAGYYLDDFRKHAKSGESIFTDKNQLTALKSIEVAA